jgi:hypothetical protein
MDVAGAWDRTYTTQVRRVINRLGQLEADFPLLEAATKQRRVPITVDGSFTYLQIYL